MKTGPRVRIENWCHWEEEGAESKYTVYTVIVTLGPDVILLLGVETGAQGRIQIMPWAPDSSPGAGKGL